jgi:hypothetical protein
MRYSQQPSTKVTRSQKRTGNPLALPTPSTNRRTPLLWRTPVQEFTQDFSQGDSGYSFYEEEEDKKSSDKEKEIIIAKTRPRVDDKQEELL